MIAQSGLTIKKVGHAHSASELKVATVDGIGISSHWKADGLDPAVFNKEVPLGFRELRAHDLRHTYGRRLRSAGVSKEDRKDLLGHKSGDVTTDYSAAELMSLIKAANLTVRSKDSPTLTVLRLVA